MKRLISILTVCLVLIICICSCNVQGDPTPPDIQDTTQSSQTVTTEPDTSEPDTSEPDTSEPGATESDTTESNTTESDTTESDTTDRTQPPVDCTHKDNDDNGICDECTVSVMVAVDFYAINDLHGKFNDTDSQPGVDELSTYLQNATKTDDHTVIFSSGDMWQGSSESGLTKGLIVTDWMNEMGFAFMTLGNHEFDWGEQTVRDNQALAQFPFLAINIYNRDTQSLADYCTPSILIDKGDIQIGVIGAIGDCYSSISADKVEDVYFVTGKALTELIKTESEALRAQGADMIVVSMHDGGSSSGSVVSDGSLSGYYDVTLSDGYVDLVFEGHTHRNYVQKDSKGVYHLQGGGDNDGITHAEVHVNSVTGTLIVTTAEYLPTQRYEALDDHPVVEQLNQKYADQLAAGNVVLGYNAKVRYSNQIKQKVAELYLAYGLERWDAKYDIVLGGGYLNTRAPYDLAKGDVQYSDLQMLLPFDNQIVLCSIKGSDLLNRFINTSNSSYYIALSDYGNGVKNSIDRNATYYIITDSYCASYAPNRLTVVETYDQTTFARDLIADYIQGGGWSQ